MFTVCVYDLLATYMVPFDSRCRKGPVSLHNINPEDFQYSKFCSFTLFDKKEGGTCLSFQADQIILESD